MSYTSRVARHTVIGMMNPENRHLLVVLVAVLVLVAGPSPGFSQPASELKLDAVMGQAVFDTPADAASAFVSAIAQGNSEMLRDILGEDFRKVLPLDEVDSEDVDRFLAAWNQRHSLLAEGEKKRLISVGEDEWTMPVPIVAGKSGWHFDIEEGKERMLIRRIGRNELDTMQAVLAYYDAQMEYAEYDHDGDGKLEYARRVISSPGTRDGLYWEAGPDEDPSPLGPLIADDTPGGGYHGYFYRILEGQGEHARDGAYSYLIGDQMRAGFALVAWPVEYGESGVMSFMVSHAGIVYEKDLGPDGASIAVTMQKYDPGPGWVPAKEVNGPQYGSASQ